MSKRRVIKIFCGVITAVTVIGVVLPMTVHTRTFHTCLHCRAERTDHPSLGYSWQRFRDTEFTSWFQTNRPAHRHAWERCSCTRGENTLGQATLWACGHNHPIGLFKPQDQLEFVRKVDAAGVSEFYTGILSTNREAQSKAIDDALNNLLENK